MKWGVLLGILFFAFVVFSLSFYWFFPYGNYEFSLKPKNYNFSIGNLSDSMQFYPNMRYLNSLITYKIENCTSQKYQDMVNAFEFLSSETVLRFEEVDSNEEISVKCDDKTVYEGNLFIAGEGGPSNITRAGEFNLIEKGEILLLKESKCEKPNVAIHELLHSLGFNHSQNKNNMMYPVSSCSQTLGEDIPDLINKIYSFQNYPDLELSNASAYMKGKFLFLNISVRNNGLSPSGNAKIIIFSGDTLIKEIDLEEIDVGYGMSITLSNVFVLKFNIDEIKINLESNFKELSKENNELTLQIKK